MRIYKYELKIQDRQNITMDWDARLLSVQFQDGKLCLWAMVDTNSWKSHRTIRIVGTGMDFDPDGLVFIGTVQQDGFVWHVFEVR